MPNVFGATNALNTNENTRQLYFHIAPHSLTLNTRQPDIPLDYLTLRI
jgi:hypothetical protein